MTAKKRTADKNTVAELTELLELVTAQWKETKAQLAEANELLAKGKRTLIVPRVAPRQEQLIRARRLERTGHVDVLLPADARHSALEDWLDDRSRAESTPAAPIDLDGLQRLPGLLLEAMSPEPGLHEMRLVA